MKRIYRIPYAKQIVLAAEISLLGGSIDKVKGDEQFTQKQGVGVEGSPWD